MPERHAKVNAARHTSSLSSVRVPEASLEDEAARAASLRLAGPGSGALRHRDIRALQRAAGNRAVSGLLRQPAAAGTATALDQLSARRGAPAQTLALGSSAAELNRPSGPAEAAPAIQRQTAGGAGPAPVARIKPQVAVLHRLGLMLRLARWMEGRLLLGRRDFQTDQLLAELSSAAGPRRAAPVTQAELQDVLAALEESKVLRPALLEAGSQPQGSRYVIVSVEPLAGLPQLIKEVRAREKLRDPGQPVFPSTQIPREWSPDPRIAKTEDKIRKKLGVLRAKEQFCRDHAMSVTPSLADAIRRHEEALKHFARYRTFATPVVDLLTRVRQVNRNCTFSNYSGHYWGKLSVDVFIRAEQVTYNFDAEGNDITGPAAGTVPVPLDARSGKYWEREKVRQFFRDLNAAAMDGPGGKPRFAWRGVYNDKPLAKEINSSPELGGANRISQARDHGPAPHHKLHIHLDIAPLAQRWSAPRRG